MEIATLNNLLVTGGSKFLNETNITPRLIVDGTSNDNNAAVSVQNSSHKLSLHVSSSGNAGLYHQTKGWLLNLDSNGAMNYMGGKLSGTLALTHSTNTYVSLTNSTTSRKVTFIANDNNNAGLYDDTNGKWMIMSNGSGTVTLNGSAVSTNTLNNTSSPVSNGLQYTSGGRTIGTAAGNAYKGSSGTYSLWSYPDGDNVTTQTSTIANIMNLRFSWGTDQNYFHDLFMSPNYDNLWHRHVNNKTPGAWKKILDSDNYTNYPAATVTSTFSTGTASQAYAPILFSNTGPNNTTNAKSVCHNDNAFGIMMTGGNSATDGTAEEGYAILQIGNALNVGEAYNKRGRIRMYGKNQYYQDIYGAGTLTNNVPLFLPDNTASGHIVATNTTGSVGGTAIPVYINGNGIATACKVNGNGSWHNSGVAVQTGAVLEIGQYIDFHNSTSTNDYDVRLNAGTTRNSLNVVYPVAPTAAGILRNIQISTTDLTAGSSALTNGYVYLVYE